MTKTRKEVVEGEEEMEEEIPVETEGEEVVEEEEVCKVVDERYRLQRELKDMDYMRQFRV